MLTLPVHSQPQHWPWGAGCIFCCENCLVHCRLLVASWPLPTPCHSTHTSPSSAVITTCVSRHGQCPLGSKIHPLDWEPLLQTYTKNFFFNQSFFFYIKKTILNLNLNWISPYICSKSTQKTYCVSTTYQPRLDFFFFCSIKNNQWVYGWVFTGREMFGLSPLFPSSFLPHWWLRG